MLSDWLIIRPKRSLPYRKFTLFEVDEKVQMDESAKNHLTKIIQDSRYDPKIFETYAEKLGWEQAQKILWQRQPTDLKMRKGFFGEVLLCTILAEFLGYLIPIQKWRFAITANQSLAGTDAIAIKMDGGNVSEVCFVESKLRTYSDANAAVQGYRQLKADHSKQMPDMIFFTMCRLQEKGDPLFAPFSRYVFDRRNLGNVETLCLGLTWDQDAWIEAALSNLEEDMDELNLPRLVVKRILIKDQFFQSAQILLRHKFKAKSSSCHIFNKIGMGETSDDD